MNKTSAGSRQKVQSCDRKKMGSMCLYLLATSPEYVLISNIAVKSKIRSFQVWLILTFLTSDTCFMTKENSVIAYIFVSRPFFFPSSPNCEGLFGSLSTDQESVVRFIRSHISVVTWWRPCDLTPFGLRSSNLVWLLESVLGLSVRKRKRNIIICTYCKVFNHFWALLGG
jgi:hypothetical protein